jgi:two-component system, chemotaxis family, protein-glutamate methylesterase/glutaminase
MTRHSPIPETRAKRAAHQIRVMLVDDSKVARSIFARVLGGSDQISISAEAADSAEALQILATERVDVILLDIEMPQRSGLDALPEILAASHGARVIVVSSFVEENGSAALEALSLGACDTLAKPGRAGFGGRFTELLVEKVVRLAGDARKAQLPNWPTVRKFEVRQPACIAIGASTGGIPVIYKLIKELDQELTCPVFIVQHLPDAFMDFFARQLATYTDRSVSVATPGTEVLQGHIYVAPGDAHLTCRKVRGKILIDYQKSFGDSRYCPSVDALFSSVASVYGSEALAIVLSGMGNDGTAGARKLAECGAIILAQDADSSVVWGMPGAVARENLANAVMSPDGISRTLKQAAAQ